MLTTIQRDSPAKTPEKKGSCSLARLENQEPTAPITSPKVKLFGIKIPPKTIVGLIFNFFNTTP